MYEKVFKRIENKLRSEDGTSNELDYVEQISWLLFLKYLSDYEIDRRIKAELAGDDYTSLFKEGYRWEDWAFPVDDNGRLDHNVAPAGPDLIAFVNADLFPYLKAFADEASNVRSIKYKIGEIFTELSNKFRSGYILRLVIDEINDLNFNKQASRHELSELYETRIKRMGNAGRNGGEYYTPRPLIRAMIRVVAPKVGETIYDGAAGSAGFLCEAWEYFQRQKPSAQDLEILQTRTFYGQEKKILPYIVGVMNMLLHGIEEPHLLHTNTLNENVMDYQDSDRHDVILANPPFGGDEQKGIERNFPIPSSETSYLFLQHFMRKLKLGGRGAVVIKNTFLSNTDNASIALRKELLERYNLHTILVCPQRAFLGAGVRTVVLFFSRGTPTENIGYYQLEPERNLGKTNPLNDRDLLDFLVIQAEGMPLSESSWSVPVNALDKETYDLSVKNPNIPEEPPLRSPQEILADIKRRDDVTAYTLNNINILL